VFTSFLSLFIVAVVVVGCTIPPLCDKNELKLLPLPRMSDERRGRTWKHEKFFHIFSVKFGTLRSLTGGSFNLLGYQQVALRQLAEKFVGLH
jgi:hypothetical protein